MAEQILATLRNAVLVMEYVGTGAVETRQGSLPVGVSPRGLLPDHAVLLGDDGVMALYEWTVPVEKPLAYRLLTRSNAQYEHGIVEFRDQFGLTHAFDQEGRTASRKPLNTNEQDRGRPIGWQFGWSIKRPHRSVTLFNEVVGNNSSQTTLSLTIVQPTQNNTMMTHGCMWFSASGTTVSITTPATFLQDKFLRLTNGSISHISSKVAGAAEGTTVTQTFVSAPGGVTQSLWYAEVSGLLSAAPPADVSAGVVDTGGNVSSRSSGTTATLAQAEAFAVAGFATHLSVTGRSYTNTFLEESVIAPGSFTANQSVATKVLAATTAVETTLAWTSAVSRAQGMVVVYTQLAAGAAPTAIMTSPPGDMDDLLKDDVVVLEGEATGGEEPYQHWSWSAKPSV